MSVKGNRKKESPQELARAIRNALDAAIATVPPAEETS